MCHYLPPTPNKLIKRNNSFHVSIKILYKFKFQASLKIFAFVKTYFAQHCVENVQIRSYFWSVFGHFSRSARVLGVPRGIRGVPVVLGVTEALEVQRVLKVLEVLVVPEVLSPTFSLCLMKHTILFQNFNDSICFPNHFFQMFVVAFVLNFTVIINLTFLLTALKPFTMAFWP